MTWFTIQRYKRLTPSPLDVYLLYFNLSQNLRGAHKAKTALRQSAALWVLNFKRSKDTTTAYSHDGAIDGRRPTA
jgi:hypothetical protein